LDSNDTIAWKKDISASLEQAESISEQMKNASKSPPAPAGALSLQCKTQRHNNEDRYRILDPVRDGNPERFFAVFDGMLSSELGTVK
jgi:hypothetical protein